MQAGVKRIYAKKASALQWILAESLRILAVTHVALIRVLIIYYNNLSMDDYRKIAVPNSAVYLLDNKAQMQKIVRVL